MKKILNWKYAFFCIYALCSLALISGVDNTYAAGNPFESNIKTDPTALVLGDVVPGSGVSSLSVEPGQRWYFNSGATVVNNVMAEMLKYGVVVTDQFMNATYHGRSWNASQFFILDSGQTKEFLVESPDDSTEVYLSFVVPSSTAETLYEVFLEPTVTDEGDPVRLVSFNPHIQFIGGYEFKYQVWADPEYSAVQQQLDDATEWWGDGKKEGGSGGLGLFRISSPNQKLIIKFTSFGNANKIKFTILGYEIDEGVIE